MKTGDLSSLDAVVRMNHSTASPFERFAITARSGICTGCAGALFIIIVGCATPIDRIESDAVLHESLTTYGARELHDVEPRDITLEARPSALSDVISEERFEELEMKAGPNSYPDDPIEVGTDLAGEHVPRQSINLRDAVLSTVTNNLELQSASINPGVSEASIVGAEAQFDAVWVTNLGFEKTDRPTPTSVIGGFATGTGLNASKEWRMRTGIQRRLITGGSVSAATQWGRSENQNPGLGLSPDPAIVTLGELSISQPLLRGFGSEVALSQIHLSRNAHRSSIEQYRNSVLDIVNQTEAAYWSLYFERQALRVVERLLERGLETRDRLEARSDYDAKPSEIADARSRVQTREILVARRRDSVVRSSDILKSFMNSPGLEVGGETMIVPIDRPIEGAITYNYHDAVMTALRHRPEVRQSVVAIDNASIREMVRDNLRMPRLDLEALVRWNGLDDSTSDSFSSMTDDQFVDFVVNAILEVPIGNRSAESAYRQAKLQRMQSVIDFQRVVQLVTRQVKEAVRAVRLNYELIAKVRDARVAAAESLRTIEVQEQFMNATTPEFLNLKFQKQEQLASSELEEMQVLIDYQISLANLYTVMGVSLERNQIEFIVPEHDDADIE